MLVSKLVKTFCAFAATSREFAYNALFTGPGASFKYKWCNIGFRRWAKGEPNHNVLVMTVQFECKVVLNRLMLMTANDCRRRDPSKWILYGGHSEDIDFASIRADDALIDSVVLHQSEPAMLSGIRGKRHWFSIDVDTACCKARGGYDVYVFAVYDAKYWNRSQNYEVQIGRIGFECSDSSKLHLIQEFTAKSGKLMRSYYQKGLSAEEMQQIVANTDLQM